MCDKYEIVEELWSRQQITEEDVDYKRWEQQREILEKTSDLTGHCMFAVDVYNARYSYASKGYADLLGYDTSKLEHIEREGDYFESRFHPKDYDQLLDMQILLSRFIYSLPPEHRNDYQNIYQFRMLNARNEYVNVISKQHVLLTDRKEKAWIILGMTDIAPDQSPLEHLKCTVVNRKTGEIFTPSYLSEEYIYLTKREKEILKLIQQGALSKEIADRLQISIHTVNNHRKNILGKLKVDNFFEAVNVVNKFSL